MAEKADDAVRDKGEPSNEKGASHPDAEDNSNETRNPASKGDEVSETHEAGQDETEDEHEHEHEDEQDPEEEPVRPRSSRASSVFSRTQSVVPRSERRGIFGRFAIIPEVDRPYEYTDKTKWAITAIIALAAAAAPLGSGIFYRTFARACISRLTDAV